MQLFLFLNDLAGRWPLLDGAARLFYIGALPVLGTLLLTQLLLSTRSPTGASRSKTALALVLALVLGALLVWGFDLLSSWLHLGNLSPRPWMTRRVNWLVVEPQDNSFPCTEVVFAATFAAASWHLSRRLGIVSWVLVALFGLVRMFCGNNYFADIFVGIALGLGCFLLCIEACERHLALGVRARQLSLSASPLAVTLAGCYIFGLFSPRFASKLGMRGAVAASPAVVKVGATSTAATLNQGEGEGMEPDIGQAEELALAKRSALFLPQVEGFLRGKLTPLAHPFQLLDVEVAPVKAGDTSYRCAALRFEVPVAQNHERRMVADCAAKLVRAAFLFDSQLQNVDVIAVARDDGRNLDNSQMVFVGDEVPVLTASVQRKNLLDKTPTPAPTKTPLVPTVPKVAIASTAQNIDGLVWLRARSRIYINERVLPYQPEPTATPQPLLTPKPGMTPTASPSATSGMIPTPKPTPSSTPPATTPVAKPSPRAKATSTPMPRTSLSPRSTPHPTSAKTPTPTATATKRWLLTPKPLPTVTTRATPKATKTSIRAATPPVIRP